MIILHGILVFTLFSYAQRDALGLRAKREGNLSVRFGWSVVMAKWGEIDALGLGCLSIYEWKSLGRYACACCGCDTMLLCEALNQPAKISASPLLIYFVDIATDH
jgi:hypothetical protein